jgi:hypothetical protein
MAQQLLTVPDTTHRAPNTGDGTEFGSSPSAVMSALNAMSTEMYGYGCYLAADYTLLNSTTAQAAFNSTTAGALTVAANAAYFFEEQLLITNTGTTSHTWSTLFAGTATLTSIGYSVVAYTGTTSNVTLTAASSANSLVATAVAITAASTSATENITALLKGIFVPANAGTLIPQVKLSAATGVAALVKAGSYFRCWPLGSGSAVSFGPWT